MSEHKLVALAKEEAPDTFLVCSPAVGVLDRSPKAGLYLNPMEVFMGLEILGRHHPVLLPRKVQGRITELMVEGMHTPVEFNQPLFRLKIGGEQAIADEQERAAAKGAGQGKHDLITIPSPSDGIFYRKPAPESPCYVDSGTVVTRGTVLGLVEVMKSFNQILYGGPELPDQATVVEIKVEDATEVSFGQALFLIKP